MVRIPTNRKPTHPGEMLLVEFLQPMGITQKELATSIHVPYQRVNEIINKKRGYAKYCSPVSQVFWHDGRFLAKFL